MRKIAILVNSTTCLTPSDYPGLHIYTVPLSVNFDGKSYLDGIDITPSAFYKMLEVSRTLPTTSQPSAESYNKFFKKLIREDFDVLALTLSSKLSGTWDSAMLGAKGLPEGRVEIVDTLTASLPEAMIALVVADAAKTGASLLECKNLAEDTAARTHIYFAVDTLEYLHKGGRIGSAAKFIGSALGLKPILTVNNGFVEALERVRTTKKAHERLLDLVEKGVGHKGRVPFLGITSSNASEAAHHLLAEAHKRFRIQRDIINELSPVIGVHTGPGTLGIVYIAEG
ncbi:MAG: DegV family protein [Anaerolineaceae bacterium]